MSNPRDEQILELWQQGVMPEGIAECLDISLSIALAVLYKAGELGRMEKKDEGLTEVQRLLKDSEVEVLKQLIQMAKYGENESAKAKAAIYVNEEIKGRNEARAKVSSANALNVKEIHFHMDQAKEAVERSLRKAKPVLELEVA